MTMHATLSAATPAPQGHSPPRPTKSVAQTLLPVCLCQVDDSTDGVCRPIGSRRFSNRERIAIFHPRFHPLAQKARATTRPPKVQPRFRPLYSSSQPRASSLQNLIANPQLEFPATTRKQSIGIESNRKKIAVFASAVAIAIFYFDSQPFRRVPPAYLLAGARDLRSLITCHSSLVTGFLIYRTAIRNPCKALKT
jgi:hypothetical protein